jgi:type III pantothenate kinase
MLLALDVGNTQTVIGVFADSAPERRAFTERAAGELPGLVHSWRVATVADRTADEHALLILNLLELSGIVVPGRAKGRSAATEPVAVIDGFVVSSSVPSVTAALRLTATSWFDVPFVVVGPGVKTGMPILYDDPREVGADRVVNAVAAIDLFGGPAIVVDLGTATTFDVISAAGEYLGGAIVPGIEISMGALFEHAAALRRVELVAPDSVIGRSTVESIQAGAVYGFASLVDGLCRRIEKEIGPATVIATGGLGALVVPHADTVAHHEPWLTLHGLRIVYERNAPSQGGASHDQRPGGTR